MKTFSILVVVATMLTFICVQENSAVPLTEIHLEEPMSKDSSVAEHPEISEDSNMVQELEEPMSNENAAVDLPEISVDSWKMPYLNNRKKLHIKCKFCCGCCGHHACCLKCKY